MKSYIDLGNALSFAGKEIENRTEEKIYFSFDETLSSLEIWSPTTKKQSIPLPLSSDYLAENRGQGVLNLVSIDKESRLSLSPDEEILLAHGQKVINKTEKIVEIALHKTGSLTFFTEKESLFCREPPRELFLYEQEKGKLTLSHMRKTKKQAHSIYQFCPIQG